MRLLSSLPRASRARSHKSTRAFRPSVVGLEERQLLADVARIIQVAGPPPVVGGAFELQVLKDPNAPAIARTTWTISGAYAASSNPRPADQGGYQYVNFGTETVAGDKISGYWNGDSGAHAVSVRVEYVPLSIVGVPYPSRFPDVYSDSVGVLKPSSYMFTTSTGLTNVKLQPWGGTLGTMTTGGPGITFKAGVDATAMGVSGTFGVVQTFTADITMSDSWGDWRAMIRTSQGPLAAASQSFTTSPTLLDTRKEFVYPYYGIAPYATGNVTPGSPVNSITMADSPSSPIDGNSGDTYRRSDKFTDTLMFQPAGGLPVPLGSLTWGWTGVVDNSIKGQPRLVASLSSNPKATQYSTTADARALPSWQDLSTNGWLNDNWVLVAANPATDASIPPPIIAAPFSLGDEPNDPTLAPPPPPPTTPPTTPPPGGPYLLPDPGYDPDAVYDDTEVLW